MDLISLTIDGVQVEVAPGTTVLEAARQAGIRIPTLCYLKDINEIGACRMCVVDTGARALQAACVLPVAPNMKVKTNTPAVRAARKMNLELLLSNHDRKCLSCVRSTTCELQAMCLEYGVDNEDAFAGSRTDYKVDDSSPSLIRDPGKCILCRRCIAVCDKVQNVGAIGMVHRGFNSVIQPAWNHPLGSSPCINCGQCINVCPTGALTEKDDTAKVWDAINDPTKFVVVQPAPAVRAALGEEFGMPMGTSVTGKMATALHRLGFDKVFDTDFGADLTIMEEAYELVDRVKNGGVLPMITSCSPGWIKFCEEFYPECLPNLSSCKSPHEMVGAVIKSYFAEKNGIDPKDIVTVSVMPCVAKKFEAARPELGHDGMADVDIVITTRELARMIKEVGINFPMLPDGDFDEVLGDSTGAAVIFGATGGVMEAALRTAYEVITGGTLADVNFTAVRGIEGVKEATVMVGDLPVKVAVANSTGAASKVMDKVKDGTADYTFIEIMACPGGCVNGGGQPVQSAAVKAAVDLKAKRASILYNADKNLPIRKSHENLAVQKIYDEYLEKPGSHLAHEILHTHYIKRGL